MPPPPLFSQTAAPCGNKYGRAAVADLLRVKEVVFVIARSRNGNLVTFAVTGRKEHTKEGVEQFWLDVDPEYRKKRNTVCDRVEMTVLDRQGYGYSVRRDNRGCVLTMDQLPSKNVQLHLKDNQWGAYTKIGNEMARLEYVWVQEKPKLGGMLPCVNYVELHGRAVSNNAPVCERICK